MYLCDLVLPSMANSGMRGLFDYDVCHTKGSTFTDASPLLAELRSSQSIRAISPATCGI